MNFCKCFMSKAMKVLALTIVFVGVNSACAFFIGQEKMPETASDMKLW